MTAKKLVVIAVAVLVLVVFVFVVYGFYNGVPGGETEPGTGL